MKKAVKKVGSSRKKLTKALKRDKISGKRPRVVRRAFVFIGVQAA